MTFEIHQIFWVRGGCILFLVFRGLSYLFDGGQLSLALPADQQSHFYAPLLQAPPYRPTQSWRQLQHVSIYKSFATGFLILLRLCLMNIKGTIARLASRSSNHFWLTAHVSSFFITVLLTNQRLVTFIHLLDGGLNELLVGRLVDGQLTFNSFGSFGKDRLRYHDSALP